MKIISLSNSQRHLTMAELFKNDGHTVEIIDSAYDIPARLWCDILVLPIPSLNKNGFLNIAGIRDVKLEEILAKCSSETTVIACNFEDENMRVFDINKYEPFVSMNAIPSAEGAIFEAMKIYQKTLFESRVLIIGYGRIGKIIADRMKGLGAKVCVTARNHKDILFARANSIGFVPYDELDAVLSEFDIIFQTVPYLILDKDRINRINGIIIELASKGAGTDMAYAESTGKRIVYAPALPERYSPTSAGVILYDSIKGILKEKSISI